MTTDQPVAGAPEQRVSAGRRLWGFLRDILVIVLIAVLVSFVVKTFLVRSFYIPSSSMENTLQVNDRIFVDQITPRFGGYERGDVVVFQDPGGWLPVKPRDTRAPFVQGAEYLLSLVGLAAPDSEDHLVKRVIGLPGDRVVCCNSLGQVEVNGAPINETPYLKLDSGKPAPDVRAYDVVVPEGSLWVLGDNRDRSQDSRFHMENPGGGFVPLDNVVGRTFVVAWPLTHFHTVGSYPAVFSGVPDAAEVAP